MIKLAAWNVNSIKARLPVVLDWLKSARIDVALLQETKTVNEAFPAMEFEELGYNLALHGQKTYNGVAILSKFPISDIVTVLPGDQADEQARYIEAVISLPGEAVRAVSVYVPNGMDPASDKFQYKLRFLERLKARAEELLTYDEKLIIGGDFNVAPEDIDVHDPKNLRGSVCFHPEEQKRFRALCHAGLTDLWRACHPGAAEFSWWDYRGGAFDHGHGLRIDMLLASPQAADCITECDIDPAPRALEKSSDHAPVWCGIAAASAFRISSSAIQACQL